MSIPFTLRLTVDVDGFSLRIDESFEATAVALFGPSGAGKTTILDAIAGFRAPDRGAIRIGARTLYSSADGIDVRSRDRRVGYVPQDLAIFPHLRVRGNILYGAGRGADETALERVTGLLEIQDLLGRRVDRLSGGERQRVALARALMSRPDVLLLDEPLAALHASLRQRIIPYLERIRDELRVPIVYVSHDEVELRRVADWVISLERGSVTASGPIASLSPPPSPANRSTP